MIHILPLDWDSSFFNLKIGRAVLETRTQIEEVKTNKDHLRESFDLIYVILNDCQLSFDDKDSFLADHKTTFTKNINGKYLKDSHVRVFNESRPCHDLYELAIRSGIYSRFRVDPFFSENSFVKLYHKWIEQSVTDNNCRVFCYYEEDKIVGMLTLDIHENADSARIGLTAVSPEYSRKGIGTSLIETSCAILSEKGISHIETVTQLHNKQACRWYEKNGFVIKSISKYYHWWLKNSRNNENIIQ